MNDGDAISFGKAGAFTAEELQLAARNHAMPLEVLRYPLTPTGLHYLLIHYDIPHVEPDAWRLTIGGDVARPAELSLADLRSRPAAAVTVTMECAGNGRAGLQPRPLSQPWLLEAVGTATWTGTPVWPLLEEAGIDGGALEIVFRGLDRGVEGGVEQSYERSLPVAELARAEVLLAYEMNGQPLLPQHGAPVRLVVPGWYGMTNVKWLAAISVIKEPFLGYQQARAYRFRRQVDDPGTPLSRMEPRALMVPPGIPDFYTRRRALPAGRCVITGRAWSGWASISEVEVSVDGGQRWQPAILGEEELGRWAWRPWLFEWQASDPGDYVLACRAGDELRPWAWCMRGRLRT